MNTKKEIIAFLEELAIGVQGKRDNFEKTIKTIESRDGTRSTLALLHEYQLSFEHTEGQLYEINYILGALKRDRRLKNA